MRRRFSRAKCAETSISRATMRRSPSGCVAVSRRRRTIASRMRPPCSAPGEMRFRPYSSATVRCRGGAGGSAAMARESHGQAIRYLRRDELSLPAEPGDLLSGPKKGQKQLTQRPQRTAEDTEDYGTTEQP